MHLLRAYSLEEGFFYMIILLFGGQSEIQFMLSCPHGRYIFIMSTLNWFNKFSGFITPTFYYACILVSSVFYKTFVKDAVIRFKQLLFKLTFYYLKESRLC
jgi:hypothetical protein